MVHYLLFWRLLYKFRIFSTINPVRIGGGIPPPPPSLRLFALYSKNLQATHTWHFLAFGFGYPYEFFSLKKLVYILPLAHPVHCVEFISEESKGSGIPPPLVLKISKIAFLRRLNEPSTQEVSFLLKRKHRGCSVLLLKIRIKVTDPEPDLVSMGEIRIRFQSKSLD